MVLCQRLKSFLFGGFSDLVGLDDMSADDKIDAAAGMAATARARLGAILAEIHALDKSAQEVRLRIAQEDAAAEAAMTVGDEAHARAAVARKVALTRSLEEIARDGDILETERGDLEEALAATEEAARAGAASAERLAQLEALIARRR